MPEVGRAFVKDNKKGKTKPGTRIDPNPYHRLTTDGTLKANPKAMNAVTAKPFRIN